MRNKAHISDPLWRLALQQDGVLGHRQVSAQGYSRHHIQRFLDDRVLWQLIRGIYGLSPEPSWTGLAWGGVLLGGDGAALGGRSAGHLYGLCDAPSTIDVLVPRRAKDRGCWRFRNTRPDAVGTLPRTRIDETALALCAEAGPVGVLSILSRTVGDRLTTAGRMIAELGRRPNLRNRGLILEVLGDVAAGVHSALEERFCSLLRSHGLPEPVRQGSVAGGTFSDNVYEEFMVVIELDGRLGHEGAGKWRDMKRDNRNALVGWITLRYGWWDVVERPCEVAAQIAELLRSRGWKGSVRFCATCRA